ncbi:MAG: phytanoyl-CoA dioxygenase family protein [Polyangiaceae bacterium]|nr:phytanoyl-CoA dioxygenase family protein [Polyangiaceae bacterium]
MWRHTEEIDLAAVLSLTIDPSKAKSRRTAPAPCNSCKSGFSSPYPELLHEHRRRVARSKPRSTARRAFPRRGGQGRRGASIEPPLPPRRRNHTSPARLPRQKRLPRVCPGRIARRGRTHRRRSRPRAGKFLAEGRRKGPRHSHLVRSRRTGKTLLAAHGLSVGPFRLRPPIRHRCSLRAHPEARRQRRSHWPRGKDGVVFNRYIRTKGSLRPGLAWHTDWPARRLYGQLPGPMLNVGLHFERITPEDGGLRIIPGSHNQDGAISCFASFTSSTIGPTRQSWWKHGRATSPC